MNSNTHTISLFVTNKPGVLLRVSLVFARRGFNIESLVVSSALDGRYSRMTITAKGEDRDLDQIIKQVSKLIDVVHVTDHISDQSIERELALIKIKTGDNLTEILQVLNHFKAETVDLTHNSVSIQATGDTDKIDAMLKMLGSFEIIEMVRSGKMLMVRGDAVT